MGAAATQPCGGDRYAHSRIRTRMANRETAPACGPSGVSNRGTEPRRATLVRHARKARGIPALSASSRRTAMCDYSLHHVMSRPAAVGDKLVSTTFPGTITRGFAARGDPNTAVCLLPGTEVAFADDV